MIAGSTFDEAKIVIEKKLQLQTSARAHAEVKAKKKIRRLL